MKIRSIMTKKISAEQIIYGGLVVLIALMPFHAFFTTYLGSLSRMGPVWQAWKEIVALVIAAVGAFYIFKHPGNRPKLDRVNYLVAAIIVLALAVSLIRFGSLTAFIFGIKTDLMPLVIFVVAQVVASRFNDQKVYNLVVWPALIVALLAILQSFAITPEMLRTLGYNETTIIPAQYVDSATMVRRAFSSLGGPNQLGAYLILPITLVTGRLVDKFDTKKAMILATLITGLYLTYSRSAWLGAALAILVTVFLGVKKSWRPKIIIAVVIALTGGLLFVTSRNFCNPNNIVQYYLLHGSCSDNTLKGSDQIRLKSLEGGVATVVENPLGKGLGAAGPASYYAAKSLITENWYLQIAIEIGLVGLILFLAFLGFNAISLLREGLSSQNLASISLFASIVGLASTNMFLHSFSDSTLAIVLFAILGIHHGRRA